MAKHPTDLKILQNTYSSSFWLPLLHIFSWSEKAYKTKKKPAVPHLLQTLSGRPSLGVLRLPDGCPVVCQWISIIFLMEFVSVSVPVQGHVYITAPKSTKGFPRSHEPVFDFWMCLSVCTSTLTMTTRFS